jgi:hypothetical protein
MQLSRARFLSSALTTVGVGEHLVLGAGILDPVLARFDVHRAQLPALARIADAVLEATLLFLVVDREPVFDEVDARAHQHLLEQRAGAQELAVFLLAAELHHPLDAGAVVPAAVEQHDLAARRQLGDVALEVPLPALPLGRRAERDHPADARVEALGDAFDDAALAGRVATLEDDHDLEAVEAHPLLQLDQLELQMGKFFDVVVILGRLVRLAALGEMPILLDRRHFLAVPPHQFHRLALAMLGHGCPLQRIVSSE